MSQTGRWFDSDAPSFQTLIEELEPGQRFAANWLPGLESEGEVMVGGVYRDADGCWFVYTEDATEQVRDGVAAFAAFGDASRAWWEQVWVVYVEPYASPPAPWTIVHEVWPAAEGWMHTRPRVLGLGMIATYRAFRVEAHNG